MMRRDEDITQELHIIRPHLFRYISLLEDFRKSIALICGAPNPVMDTWPVEEQEQSKRLLEKECKTVYMELDRLELRRSVLEMRLANVLSLVISLAHRFFVVTNWHIPRSPAHSTLPQAVKLIK
jgi:hypothetical protein